MNTGSLLASNSFEKYASTEEVSEYRRLAGPNQHECNRGSILAKQEQVEILRQGVETWNKWRKANPGIKPDLSHVHLDEIKLNDEQYVKRYDDGSFILKGPNFRNANMESASFRKASLDNADFEKAFLKNADLTGASLLNADFSHAKLWGAKLSGCNLECSQFKSADFMGAQLDRCELGSADFSHSFGLEANFTASRMRQARLRWGTYTGACFAQVVAPELDAEDAILHLSNLSGADMRDSLFNNADFNGCNLELAILTGSYLVDGNLTGTNLKGADISRCRIHGVAAWRVQLDKQTNQVGLDISSDYEPSVTVDDIEMAQFFYLVLNHKKFRKAINIVTSKGVLLLGRFSDGGLERLEAIGKKLREYDYLPILFDFDRPEQRDFTETIITLVGLSHFVIVDLSGPSVPQELYATVPDFAIPFVPILANGEKGYATFKNLNKYPWVIRPEVKFESTPGLLDDLKERVIDPAESCFLKLQK
jgi:uncharacterized protein YjbI with pentapeptide repeats